MQTEDNKELDKILEVIRKSKQATVVKKSLKPIIMNRQQRRAAAKKK